jgi:hypothetical protein
MQYLRWLNVVRPTWAAFPDIPNALQVERPRPAVGLVMLIGPLTADQAAGGDHLAAAPERATTARDGP